MGARQIQEKKSGKVLCSGTIKHFTECIEELSISETIKIGDFF